MRTYIIILICCQFFFSNTNGQEAQLVLTNKKTHVERVLEPGKTMRVYRSEYYFSKGKLSIVNAATIAIEGDTIQLEDIEKIEARTCASRAQGIVLATIGSVVLAGGILAIEEGISPADGSPRDEWAVGGGATLCIIGGGIAAVGIGKLVVGKNFKSKKWAYTIRQTGVSNQ